MKRQQAVILRPLVTRMRRALPRHWNELKRAAWDNCEEATHHWASEFRSLARSMLEKLSASDREALLTSFRREHSSSDRDDTAVLDYFESELIDMLIRRATTAAYRTADW